MKLAQVTHAGCHHRSGSWNLALAAALSHAGVTMLPSSREVTIRRLRRGSSVTHQGVKFTGRLVDE